MQRASTRLPHFSMTLDSVAVNVSPRYGPHAPIQGQLTHMTPPGQTLTAPTRNLAFFVHLCLSTLEIRPGTRPDTSGQFQFSGPNWPRVTPGDSPGHFPMPGGRFGDQFGSVQGEPGGRVVGFVTSPPARRISGREVVRWNGRSTLVPVLCVPKFCRVFQTAVGTVESKPHPKSGQLRKWATRANFRSRPATGLLQPRGA